VATNSFIDKADMPQLNIEDLSKVRINKEDMDKVPEEDRDFIYLAGAMKYIEGINAIDRNIMEIIKLVRKFVPCQLSDLKVIMSHLEDINPDDIDDLSSGFIETVFIVGDKPIKLTLPEVADLDEISYKRMMIRTLKMMDEQAAVAVEYKEKLKQMYMEDIPDHIKELAMNVEKADAFAVDFMKKKAQSPDVTPEQKEEFEKTLQYKHMARTMSPIIKSIESGINKAGGRDSLLHGFYRDNERTLNAAIEIAHRVHIVFPFHLMNGLDAKMFGDRYAKYKNIYVYLFARYIKYKKDNISVYDRIFLSELFSHIVVLNRPGAEEKYPGLYKDIKISLEKLLSTATGL
jgi:hypothetical protein